MKVASLQKDTICSTMMPPCSLLWHRDKFGQFKSLFDGIYKLSFLRRNTNSYLSR